MTTVRISSMLNDALAGTIAFKHDSKFTGYIVSSGDTALGSVALVCGIGLYRSLEVASTSGCWCVSRSCPGSVLLVFLVVFLFLPLVVLVSYYYLLRFDVLGCGLLALRCLLCSLSVLVSLCSLLNLVCSLCLTCSSLSSSSSLCVLSAGCVFFLLALGSSLCLTWFSLSASLAVALLLVSVFSSQSLLVYLSLVSLLVNLLCPFFMLDGPGLSRRRSRSLLPLFLPCLLLFSGVSWRPSQAILGHT